MREGFISWWYIIVEKEPILDMKRLSYSMSSLFDYLRYLPGLSRAQVFQVFFQVPLVHPWTTMDVHGIVLRLKIGI